MTQAAMRTKGGRKPHDAKNSQSTGRPPDILALKPDWGKPTVRNFRGSGGNVGIIRSPVRATALPGGDPRRAMVDLSGHEAGNGGHSQRTPTAHRGSSTRSSSLKPWHPLLTRETLDNFDARRRFGTSPLAMPTEDLSCHIEHIVAENVTDRD